MNKKGLDNWVISLIIATIVVAATLLLSSDLFGLGHRTGNEAVCTISKFDAHLSQSQNEAVERLFADGLHYEFSCPIESYFVHQKGSRTEIVDVQRESRVKRFAIENTKDEMNAFFTKELETCWRKTGDVDIFNEYVKISKQELSRDEQTFWDGVQDFFKSAAGVETVAPPVFCAICAKVQFDDEMITLMSEPVNLQNYLQQREASFQTDTSVYDILDSGRHDNLNRPDTTARYVYDASESQVVFYFKRYDYNYLYTEEAADKLGDIARAGITGIIAAKVIVATAGVTIPAGVIGGALMLSTGATISETTEATIEGVLNLMSPPQVDEVLPEEYGVAIRPYNELAGWCDILANAYET